LIAEYSVRENGEVGTKASIIPKLLRWIGIVCLGMIGAFICLFFLLKEGMIVPLPPETRDPGEIPDVLADPGSSVLYSIDPSSIYSGHPASNLPKMFGYDVLGSTPLTPAQSQELTHELQPDLDAYIAEERAGRETASMCFDPRHILEISYYGHIYDFVICFACSEVYVYKDQKIRLYFMIHSASKASFNRILIAAKVPLPTQPQ
jgi:hypothetical protein